MRLPSPFRHLANGLLAITALCLILDVAGTVIWDTHDLSTLRRLAPDVAAIALASAVAVFVYTEPHD